MTRVISAAVICGVVLSAVPIHAAQVDLVSPRANVDLRESLLSASLAAKATEEGATDSQELLAAAQADYRRLTAALYESGYYGGTVSIRVDGREASDLSVLRNVPSINRIELNVVPGPQFKFSDAVVAPLPPNAPPSEEFARGEVATTPVMRSAAQDGVTAWRRVGHAKAEVTGQRITVQHRTSTVDARFQVAPGPRLRFGEVRLTPETQRSAVRAERIRAIAGIPEGEVFSPDEIDDGERRLRRTGAFRSAVITEADLIGPGDTLPTTIDVEDAKPRRFGFGAEISNTQGLGLSSFWMHRNFLGGAERFRVDGEVKGIGGDSGGIDYRLSTSLTRPAFRHPDMNLRFAATLERNDEPSYTEDLAEVTVGIERFINEKLTGELDLGVRVSQSTDAFGSRDFSHMILRGALTWDNRNDELNPSKGAYAEAEVLPFVGFGGSETGYRFTGDLRGYAELGSDRLIAAGRLQVGTVTGAGLAGTPPQYLFFSGGGGTVRGQDYQTLGGTTVGGRTVGGQAFLGTSTELRGQITDTIGVVGFADFGYVSAASDFQGGDWHGGAGIGARYFTPIGPVRLDLAVPITGNTSGFGVYVGIGQAF